MSGLPGWDDLIAGKGCPFCSLPEDHDDYKIKVADLAVSSLFMERNQAFFGYCILIFKPRHVTGLEHLTAEEHAAFSSDLKRAGDAVFKAVQPDHMNYATLGNVIPHLHYHILPRYKDDRCWGGPPWLADAASRPERKLTEKEYVDLAEKIRAGI
jgi:diadenosine tetraphosphate (Ap4A) HIT family hydrolase